MSATVLVPVDLSPDSEIVLSRAQEFASRSRLEILLFHVVLDPSEFAGFHIPHLSTDIAREELLEGARKDMERFIANHAPDTACRIEMGVPFREILKAAEEMDVHTIVIGSHKWGGPLEHLFVSHASEKVIRHATCDVLVIPLQIESEEQLMRRARDF